MTFVDSHFIAFLALFAFLWWLARNHYEMRVGVMLWMSLIFYGYHYWWFVPIILAFCLVDWGTARLIEISTRKKLILTLGVGFNLLALSFWKYTPLLAQTVADFANWPSDHVAFAMHEGWIVPMGISFYSFIGIAYMVDVYRGTIPAERDLWRYSLFASFFPHLVAGPILRAKEFL
jgi:D-alanyl-lipoteichoic acid acyltransferase DltB (MBOAT superfamily)